MLMSMKPTPRENTALHFVKYQMPNSSKKSATHSCPRELLLLTPIPKNCSGRRVHPRCSHTNVCTQMLLLPLQWLHSGGGPAYLPAATALRPADLRLPQRCKRHGRPVKRVRAGPSGGEGRHQLPQPFRLHPKHAPPHGLPRAPAPTCAPPWSTGLSSSASPRAAASSGAAASPAPGAAATATVPRVRAQDKDVGATFPVPPNPIIHWLSWEL